LFSFTSGPMVQTLLAPPKRALQVYFLILMQRTGDQCLLFEGNLEYSSLDQFEEPSAVLLF